MDGAMLREAASRRKGPPDRTLARGSSPGRTTPGAVPWQRERMRARDGMRRCGVAEHHDGGVPASAPWRDLVVERVHVAVDGEEDDLQAAIAVNVAKRGRAVDAAA